MQRRNIKPFNPKATIAILKEDPKVGVQLDESEKRVLVDRYLEVSIEVLFVITTGYFWENLKKCS